MITNWKEHLIIILSFDREITEGLKKMTFGSVVSVHRINKACVGVYGRT